MNIAICDSEHRVVESLQDLILLWAKGKRMTVQVDCFSSWTDLQKAREEGLDVDILFLEGKLKSRPSGIEKAHDFRLTAGGIPIVILIDQQESIQNSYTVPLRFISKPIGEKALYSCLDSCREEAERNDSGNVTLRNGTEILQLPVQSIIYLEHLQRHTIVHTTDQPEPYIIRDSLSNVYKRLPKRVFLHCHKSYVINLKQVKAYQSGNITVSSGQIVPVGKAFSKDVLEALLK